MPRTASPRPTFVYRVDHALCVTLKVKNYVQPINSYSGDVVVSSEITTWEYMVSFGSSKRALFKDSNFVTFHSSPDVAVVELLSALGQSMIDQGFYLNAVQHDWVVNGSKGYGHVVKADTICDVPGATVEVHIRGVDMTGPVPVNRVAWFHPITGETNSLRRIPENNDPEDSDDDGGFHEVVEDNGDDSGFCESDQ